MTDQQVGGIASSESSNDDTDDEHRQRLQWTLEQAQLRYSELKDKSSKLMNQAAQLLGFCAISGFTTFLSKSTWTGLPDQISKNLLKKSITFLMIVVLTAAAILCVFSVTLSFLDARFPDPLIDAQGSDIAEQVQAQSSVRRMTFLIQNLSDRIRKLKWLNFIAAIALYIMYLMYAGSLEFLVLTIISSH